MTESKKILETKDYKVFKYLKGNRTIQQSWVRKLVELIKERDLQIPIIVDETMKVLDGQHRLEAYKIGGPPVKYIIKDRFGLDEVRALNSNNKKWTLTDYMESFVKLGNRDYELLQWFVEKYDMPILASVAMLNSKGYVNTKIIQAYQKGEFKIKDLEWGKEQARRIQWIGDYFHYYKKRMFIAAMLNIFQNKTFKWEIFKQRLKNNSSKLKNQGSRNDFIVNVERLYNHGTNPKNKIRLELYE